MKTIRNMTILVGLSAALFTLAATGAKAQTLSSTSFKGAFTLPLETHWGAMILPAGDYNLSYGNPFKAGIYVVAIAGAAPGSPRGMILPGGRGDVSTAKNVLNCLRDGDTLYIRTLELPGIGESVHFRLPHGVEVRTKVIARNQNKAGNIQLAQVPIRIQRVSILAAK